MRAGVSGNRNYYPEQVVREAAPLFEGVKVFSKSDEEHLRQGGKSFDNLIGKLTGPVFVPGGTADEGEIHADLVLIDPNGPEAVKIREAFDRGLADLFGFSIDGLIDAKHGQKGGVRVTEARKFIEIKSVDLIVDPGAGGRIVAALEAQGDTTKETFMTIEELIAAIQAKRPDLLEGKDLETLTEEELQELLKKALEESAEVQEARRELKTLRVVVKGRRGGVKRAVEAEGDGTEPAPEPSREEIIAMIAEKRPDLLEGKDVEALTAEELAELLKEALAESVDATAVAEAQRQIFASTLPEAAKARLVGQFMRGPVSRARVTEAIKREGEYLSTVTGGAPVSGLGTSRVRITEGQRDKIDARLDAFFNASHKDHRKAGSVREIYVQMTGDERVTGRLDNCVRITEAIGTTDWANVAGDAINREMLRVYGKEDRYDVWREIAKVGRANDFRELHRIRVGGYGDLPTVGEMGDYTYLNSPDEEAAKFGVKKRGGLERLTFEMIKNDDVGAVQDIPKKLAWAAKRTLAKGVLSCLTDNPVIYNGRTLFHVAHGNLGTAPMSPTSWEAARQAMMNQREPGSDDRLGIPPTKLLVPSVLESDAFDMFIRNTNNDEKFIQKNAPQIVSPWLWTDPKMWFAAADPSEIPCIEVAFLDGQEEPELFVQDNPTVGSLFTNDCITYKIRHIFGVGVLDASGLYCGKPA